MSKQCDSSFFWKYYPCRSLQYRWDRALDVVSWNLRSDKRFDDPYMALAIKFLRALRRCDTQKQHTKLARKMPEVYAAYNLHEAGGELELELQARILALHTTEQLAEMFAMDTAIIDMYQRLFFCLKDRHEAHDWIVSQAIGIWERDLQSLIKSLGYFGGPLVLEASLPYLLNNAISVREPLFTGAQAEKMAQRIRLFKQIWMMQIRDAKTAYRLMRAMPSIDSFIEQSKMLELEGLLAQIVPIVPQSLPELHTNTQAATKSTSTQQPMQARKENVA